MVKFVVSILVYPLLLLFFSYIYIYIYIYIYMCVCVFGCVYYCRKMYKNEKTLSLSKMILFIELFANIKHFEF